ncbi:hypothetical protein P691DRAFT_811875 [Macrolepiota fuliginosa MF-IS2]|uniref:DUF6699 domain-containing protein n=1 Tax=Macrolepiota fuliginosa MF-IS2 TaxID=1400762 RepID=A0A9P5XF16_9AGAR|nr:hypothetical protein P691DRAFT_811875 [Macrolepiota fuliginosa MF-IS2]
MPSKLVRFARTNTVHTFSSSPIPPPPALSHGGSSPASTSSLITPPDFHVPLPSVDHRSHHKRSHTTHTSSIRLHKLLENSSSPDIIYDVRRPARALESRRRTITPDEFNEAATYPPIPSMTIRHDYLPWSIRVTPTGYSRSRREPYVTVWDILKAIHSSLWTTITPGEFDALGTGSEYQRRVTRAYETRYRSSHTSYEEKMGGVRRVDYLVEFVYFMGLVAHDGAFVLRTSN